MKGAMAGKGEELAGKSDPSGRHSGHILIHYIYIYMCNVVRGLQTRIFYKK